jgi:hypothetical protein
MYHSLGDGCVMQGGCVLLTSSITQTQNTFFTVGRDRFSNKLSCASLSRVTSMLPTGDLRGNVQRVIDHLKLVSYHLPVSSRSLKAGEPTSLLPILHYCLLDFSPHVASFVSSHGYDLYGRDDATFTTAVFRLATLHLGIQPGLQAQQFLSRGFIGELFIL